jgi:UDP-N-acetylmuramoyl-tripeptide--D-alanyl-D-alanine ligase
MTIALQDVATAIGAIAPEAPAAISRWSIDSRTCEPGALFFALRGENHDGHRYLNDVFRRGAAAAIVESAIEGGFPQMRVEDTLAALTAAARWARSKSAITSIGVTGSAGKTTTKDTIAQLLSAEFETDRNEGNLNNHIGLPLSILRISDTARAAVFEMGMNHGGEIRHLASIAKPEIGVVTNIGYAHIENFESIDEIAAAKGELIDSLPSDGIAILNADDRRAAALAGRHPGRTITFGTGENAGVRAEAVEYLPQGVRFTVGGVAFESEMAGRIGVSNILAGIAVAEAMGIAPERLKDAVRSLKPGKMRGERSTVRGITVLNDCYNSNPDAARAMLEVLRAQPARKRIAVLGEMRELGRWAEPLHRSVGRYAAQCGISVLVGIRGAARHMVEEAKLAGMTDSAAYFFDEPEEAGDLVRSIAVAGDVVLFKGSRGTQVERAMERFVK